jgi:hypothetical protein
MALQAVLTRPEAAAIKCAFELLVRLSRTDSADLTKALKECKINDDSFEDHLDQLSHMYGNLYGIE